MDCKNKFCIYQSDGKCFVNEVPHDENGVCLKCIYIKISDEELIEKKKNTVEDLEYFAKKKVRKKQSIMYID